jgi:hypothetical protein
MARGPDGGPLSGGLDRGAAGLNRLEYELTAGLEEVIDRTLAGHRRGDPFVYGIHQALSPRMAEALRRRYREAGWREVILREGATGAHVLVLHP